MLPRLDRLGGGVGGDRADEEAEVVWRHRAPDLGGALAVVVEELARDVERHQERHVSVAAAAGPDRRLRARGARGPDGRVRLLERQAPWGDVAGEGGGAPPREPALPGP